MRAFDQLWQQTLHSDRTLGGTSAGPYLFGKVILSSPASILHRPVRTEEQQATANSSRTLPADYTAANPSTSMVYQRGPQGLTRRTTRN